MKLIRIFALVAVWLLAANSSMYAQKVANYVGITKCRACHMSAAKGAQYKIWQEGPHARAIETLGTDAAKETAKKAGVEGDPQQAGECLICHQTAYGVSEDFIDKGFKMGNGVECESCHGPGSLYRVASVMNAKKYAADPEGILAQWIELGLVVPTEKNCVTCHNENSPTYKEFNFEEFFAKIQHTNPMNPLNSK